MLKKRYVKRIYIEEVICDKCGSKMKSNGVVLCSFPAKYPYHCTNPDCDGYECFLETELPGAFKFEYEDEDNV